MIYATSDLHGYPLESFKFLLEKTSFTSSDKLYVLGDVIDRNGDGGIALLLWMMEQSNIDLILGNHEEMLLSCAHMFEERQNINNVDMCKAIEIFEIWQDNGGEPTLESLKKLKAECPNSFIRLLDYLRAAHLYKVETVRERIFLLVHAGLGNFNANKKPSEYTRDELLWTRPRYGEQYYENMMTILGHTPTWFYDYRGGMYRTSTWIDIDTGAGDGNHPMLLRMDDLQPFYIEQ